MLAWIWGLNLRLRIPGIDPCRHAVQDPRGQVNACLCDGRTNPGDGIEAARRAGARTARIK